MYDIFRNFWRWASLKIGNDSEISKICCDPFKINFSKCFIIKLILYVSILSYVKMDE